MSPRGSSVDPLTRLKARAAAIRPSAKTTFCALASALKLAPGEHEIVYDILNDKKQHLYTPVELLAAWLHGGFKKF